ncbi:hypothetical protein ILYODFUR_033662 [Ilyodon furcidens]|uniref:Uncharacterized protein n=1 Tax=Ilyodon furcidens TaxID=33524 RepID=A0ABV0ST14_9TELE
MTKNAVMRLFTSTRFNVKPLGVQSNMYEPESRTVSKRPEKRSKGFQAHAIHSYSGTGLINVHVVITGTNGFKKTKGKKRIVIILMRRRRKCTRVFPGCIK